MVLKGSSILNDQIGSFCNILYSRPVNITFPQSLIRAPPTLDLIVAGSDIKQLAKLLANITGINVSKIHHYKLQQRRQETLFKITKTDLKRINQVTENISSFNGSSGPLLFNAILKDEIRTYANKVIPLSENIKFNFDSNNTHFHTEPQINDSVFYDENAIQIKPKFFLSYSSLPQYMKDWLHDIENANNPKELYRLNQEQSDIIDMLFNGFHRFK